MVLIFTEKVLKKTNLSIRIFHKYTYKYTLDAKLGCFQKVEVNKHAGCRIEKALFMVMGGLEPPTAAL